MKTTTQPRLLVFFTLAIQLFFPIYSPAQLTESFEEGHERWFFNKGAEFGGGGAGGLEVVTDTAAEGKSSVRLEGDFSRAGRYVALGIKARPPIQADRLEFQLRANNLKYILVRLRDETGQTHQHQLPVKQTMSWQTLVLENLASPNNWGGKRQKEFHGTIEEFAVMIEKQGISDGGTRAVVHIDNIRFSSAAPGENRLMTFTLPIGQFETGTEGWWPYHHDRAQVELIRDDGVAKSGSGSLKATADFSKGGDWLTLLRQFERPIQIDGLELYVRSENLRSIDISLSQKDTTTFSERVDLPADGTWKMIRLQDLINRARPRGKSNAFGSEVAVRVSISKNAFSDASKAAALWIDDAVVLVQGEGVIEAPGVLTMAEKGMVTQMLLPATVPIFWGAEDRPDHVRLRVSAAGKEAVTTPKISLLDHKLLPLTELYRGGEILAAGNVMEKKLTFSLSKFGHYYLEAADGEGNRALAGIAWIKEEGQPDIEGPFGVQGHFGQGPWGKSQYLGGARGAIELMRKMGAGWVRDDLGSKFDNQDRLQYNADGYFAYVETVNEKGMASILNFVDFLQNGQPPTTAESRDKYARRFAAWVRQFHIKNQVYEVWNEPNISPGWRGKPNAADYTEILKAAYPAIKEADPSAIVVAPTSAGTDYAFIEQVLKAGGSQFMDGLGAHPYHGIAPELFTRNVEDSPVWMGTGNDKTSLGRLEVLGELLRKYHKPQMQIYATEMGYPNKSATEEWQQSCWLVRQYLLGMTDPRLRLQVAYNFQDQGVNQDEASGMSFGFIKSTGMPEARFTAYNTMSRKLYGRRFSRRIEAGEDIHLYEFGRGGNRVLALWAVDTGKAISLQSNMPKVLATDLNGNETELKVIDGLLHLGITGEPVFIENYGEITPAKTPGFTASGRGKLTGEDKLMLNIQRPDGLMHQPLTGEVPAGWIVEKAEGDTLTFTPTSKTPSGHYTFVVRAGTASTAYAVDLSNSILIDSGLQPDGNIKLAILNPFPSNKKLTVKYGEGKVEKLDLAAAGETVAELDVQTEMQDHLTTVAVTLDASLESSSIGSVEMKEGQRPAIVAGRTPCHQLSGIRVDGVLDEWQGLKPCRLAEKHQARHIERSREQWGGPDDLSADFWTGDNGEAFVLAIRIKDDEHVQTFSPGEMWKGDSVQAGFELDGVLYEFTLALKNDGEVTVAQTRPEKRIFPDAVMAANRQNGVIRMECAIPWRTFHKDENTARNLKFAMLVNDNDDPRTRGVNGGREGFLEWLEGIGSGTKEPDRFNSLDFVSRNSGK